MRGWGVKEWVADATVICRARTLVMGYEDRNTCERQYLTRVRAYFMELTLYTISLQFPFALVP